MCIWLSLSPQNVSPWGQRLCQPRYCCFPIRRTGSGSWQTLRFVARLMVGSSICLTTVLSNSVPSLTCSFHSFLSEIYNLPSTNPKYQSQRPTKTTQRWQAVPSERELKGNLNSWKSKKTLVYVERLALQRQESSQRGMVHYGLFPL